MSLGEEEAKRLGKSQVRFQESHDTCGPAGKVGVTARDVGHVGRVILGKGNHVPQGRERWQDTGHFPRWSFPPVDSALQPR